MSLARYRQEAHVTVSPGTGQGLLEAALTAHGIERRVLLDLPGFLGLGAVISSTDLIVTLPRHIGETLAQASGLTVLACPLKVEGFDVKQHWHARFHADDGNAWLRRTLAQLFGGRTPAP